MRSPVLIVVANAKVLPAATAEQLKRAASSDLVFRVCDFIATTKILRQSFLTFVN